MQEKLLLQRVHEMKETMLVHIAQHPDQAKYTFQVDHHDLCVASLVGATLCAEIQKPILVTGDQQEEHEHAKSLFS